MANTTELSAPPPLALATLKSRHLLDQARTSTIIHFLLGMLMAFIIRHHVGAQEIALWMMALVIVLGTRYLTYTKTKDDHSLTPALVKFYILTIVATSWVWGFGAYFFMSDLPFTHQLLTTFIVGWICVGAISLLSSSYRLFLVFASFMLLPLVIFHLSQENPEKHVIGYLGIIYLAALCLSAKNFSTLLANAFALQLEKQDLVAELTRDKEDLLQVQKVAKLGTWEVDIATNAATCCDEVHKILDQEPGTAESMYEFLLLSIHPFDNLNFRKELKQIITQKGSGTIEHRLVLASGKIKYVTENIEIVYNQDNWATIARGTIQDITDRRVAEQEHILQRAALSAETNAVVITDREGRIDWVNPAFTEITGYTLEEAHQTSPSVADFFMIKGAEFRNMLRVVLRGQTWNGEIVCHKKNGTDFPTRYSVTPVRDYSGTISHFVSIIEDVTEQAWTKSAMSALVDNMIGLTGEDYFDQITRELVKLYDWVEVKAAVIGVIENNNVAHCVSMYTNGKISRGHQYQLLGSPCEQVINTGPLLIKTDVQTLFPDDIDLKKFNAAAYAGVPIINVVGVTIGIMWVLSDELTNVPEGWADVFSVVATKAGTEIERLKAEQSLKQRTAYLDSVLNSATKVGIIACDLNFTINYFNPTNHQILGCSDCAMLGKNYLDSTELEIIRPKQFDEVMQTVADGKAYHFTAKSTLNNTPQSIDIDISAVTNNEGEHTGYLVISEDTTERQEQAKAIEHQAFFDSLTNLPNRRYLLTQLEKSIANCTRHGHFGALMFLDLDHFKYINDSLGHSAGDNLLREVAQRLNKSLRKNDFISRHGGDEFVILLDKTDASIDAFIESTSHVAEKILQALEVPFSIDMNRLHLTASIGIALFPLEEKSASILIQNADMAMYQAKKGGRNGYHYFSNEMQKIADKRLALRNDMRTAISNNEFELFFQVQSCAEQKPIGAEALLRWKKSDGTYIPPYEFIPIAEETGQILPIGEWVLRNALKQYKYWSESVSNFSLKTVAVNISSIQFRQQDFVERVRIILDESGVHPNCLMLELTESIFLDSYESTASKMNALKAIGVQFSIDDFGTGYSQISYMRELPVDEIKIDRSFICGLTKESKNAKLVEIILNMGRELGMTVVAEGVEEAGEFNILLEMGCTCFQGYYFHKPEGEKAFLQYLEQQSGEPELSRTRQNQTI